MLESPILFADDTFDNCCYELDYRIKIIKSEIENLREKIKTFKLEFIHLREKNEKMIIEHLEKIEKIKSNI